MPDHMRVDSLINQRLFGQGFDEAIDRLPGQGLFLIRAMFAQSIEYLVIGIDSVSIGLQIILYGDKVLVSSGIRLNVWLFRITSITAWLGYVLCRQDGTWMKKNTLTTYNGTRRNCDGGQES